MMRLVRRHRSLVLARRLRRPRRRCSCSSRLDARAWQLDRCARRPALPRASRATRLWEPSTRCPAIPRRDARRHRSTRRVAPRAAVLLVRRIGSNPEIRRTRRRCARTRRTGCSSLDRLGPDHGRALDAANLLGVLVVTTPGGNDQNVIAQILKRAANYFQPAIGIDPTNVDAKQNLELVLRITKPGQGPPRHDARSGYGFGRGQGAGDLGNGY